MIHCANTPLVSIVVITYNSAEYVLKTLESAKAQTFQKLELIVSDDGSSDHTVEICQKWLAENRDRFTRTALLTVEKNSGIPANCNRGTKAATGEWIKLIAGDDYISSEFISKCLEHEKSANVALIYTNCYFVNSADEITGQANSSNYKSGFVFDDLFFLRFWPKAPSMIVKTAVLEEVGFFDESIWAEDFLMVLKIAQKYPLQHLDEFLTYYRIHGSNNGGKSIRLHEAQLSSIGKFKDYSGYPMAKRSIQLQIIELKLTDQPAEAVQMIFNNLRILCCRQGISALTRAWISMLKQSFSPQPS